MEWEIQRFHRPVDSSGLFVPRSLRLPSDRVNLPQNRWLPVLAYIFIVWLAHHTTDVSL